PIPKKNHDCEMARVHELHRVADALEEWQRINEVVKRCVATPGEEQCDKTHCGPEPNVFAFEIGEDSRAGVSPAFEAPRRLGRREACPTSWPISRRDACATTCLTGMR